MNPNTALDLIRERVSRIMDPRTPANELDAISLADTVADLDEWLTRGGHLPLNWHTAARFAPTTSDRWTGACGPTTSTAGGDNE